MLLGIEGKATSSARSSANGICIKSRDGSNWVESGNQNAGNTYRFNPAQTDAVTNPK